MTNRSNAKGVLSILGEDQETVNALGRALTYADDFFYPTTLDQNLGDSEIDGYKKEIYSFYADGRNEYLWNIENFCRILEDKLASCEDFGTIEELADADWEICFAFEDEEFNENVLYEAVASITHYAGTDITDSDFSIEERKDYEYTWFNLMKVYGYDIDSLLKSIEDYTPEEIKIILEREIKNIAEACDCSVSEVLATYPQVQFVHSQVC